MTIGSSADIMDIRHRFNASLDCFELVPKTDAIVSVLILLLSLIMLIIWLSKES